MCKLLSAIGGGKKGDNDEDSERKCVVAGIIFFACGLFVGVMLMLLVNRITGSSCIKQPEDPTTPTGASDPEKESEKLLGGGKGEAVMHNLLNETNGADAT